MCFVPDPAQMFRLDVCINLGGGDPFMAEHLLYGAEVGAAGEKMRGKRVAKDVRRDRPGNAGALRIVFELAPNAATRNRVAVDGQEKCFWGRGEFSGAQSAVAIQGFACVGPERDDPFAAAFATDSEVAGLNVDLAGLQADDFADSQARGIEQFHDGFVPDVSVAGTARCSEQPVHLPEGQGLGELVHQPRKPNAGGRISGDLALLELKPVQMPQGNGCLEDRNRLQPSVFPVIEVSQHGIPRCLGRLDMDCVQVIHVGKDGVAVGGHGMRRETAVVDQVGDEGDQLGPR
jgi:hypothetical protein